MLLELLEKRARNEELTEEELKILAEYDAQLENTTKELKEKVDLLANEKETIVGNKTELEKKIEELNSKLSNSNTEIEKIVKEKEELEKKIVETADIEEVKTAIRKSMEAKQEEAIKREKIKQEELLKQKENELNKKLKELEEELKKQSELNKLNAFKSEVMEEKAKRPYLADKLDKILNDLEITGVQQSRVILNFLIESVNHDEEIEKYNKKIKAGSNIFNDKEIQTKTTKELKDPFEEFLKKQRNIK